MKEILKFIEQKKQDFVKLPLFKFMQDKSIDPKQRLSFAPCLVPLAMGFGELCNIAFRQEPTTNKIQELINKHTYEEHFHWQWLLEDIGKLGLDDSLRLTDAINLMWAEETKKNRAVCSFLGQYNFHADPVLRLVLIEVSEVTANVFFSITKTVAEELQKNTGQEYRYFGMCHLNVENTHTLGKKDAVVFLESIEITEETREKAFELVKLAFEAYTEAMNELLAYAKKQENSKLLQVA
ncbi:MAG: hypothetical protein KME60_13765 [Cyanomargarita calcarea GSE-NOS-MK-12-04C]|jgi:hypothetical protein|uniref:Heme oxygenase n=1 Tax=Cyanomargarita calcarea GSE-NOS-MK-12-04C TaxID=2839659 RepID=A0A951QLH5_9CYAN|nr:hypothetical protein [Cyanomargarita calcarea GSE-NOS-MK-12-04C]